MSKQVLKTQLKIRQAARKCREELGVDPTKIYCSITGRPIGTLDESILFDIFEESGFQDLDELMDDLLLRTLCSARPSPSWNIVDRKSLDIYRKTRPAETLAYLLSRLYEPSRSLKISFNERIKGYHQRIQIYSVVTRILETGINLDEWMFLLVDIDGLYNLNTLPIPKNDILASLVLIAEAHENKESWDAFMGEWREWHGKLFDSYMAKQRAALRQDNWIKGNSLAGPARVNLWSDRQPKSEATIKREAKKKLDDEITVLLRTIMDNAEKGKDSEPVTPKPVRGVIRPGQLNIAALKAASEKQEKAA